MSFCCPVHGYYTPTQGVSVALCPKCSTHPPDASGPWTHVIHRCTKCGASWYAPKDEPHACAVDALREALWDIVETCEADGVDALVDSLRLAREALGEREGNPSQKETDDLSPSSSGGF